MLVALAAFVLLSLLNGLSVRADGDVNDLRLLRSLCGLFRFVVLRHHVVDGTASHRACGCTCDSRPEAAKRIFFIEIRRGNLCLQTGEEAPSCFLSSVK